VRPIVPVGRARGRAGTAQGAARFGEPDTWRGFSMRSIILYAIGIPIPIILLLAFCTHHF
jgi:hypothetical protein